MDIHAFQKKWNAFCLKAQPVLKKTGDICKLVTDNVEVAFKYVMKFKKLFLAAPIAAGAVILAIQNMIKLPALVGLFIQNDGEYSIQIVREVAVLGPMAVTAICLLLMFISKRTLTPWLVSMISLALPLLILLTNTFSL